jgi:hypothetical protein
MFRSVLPGRTHSEAGGCRLVGFVPFRSLCTCPVYCVRLTHRLCKQAATRVESSLPPRRRQTTPCSRCRGRAALPEECSQDVQALRLAQLLGAAGARWPLWCCFVLLAFTLQVVVLPAPWLQLSHAVSWPPPTCVVTAPVRAVFRRRRAAATIPPAWRIPAAVSASARLRPPRMLAAALQEQAGLQRQLEVEAATR